MNTKHTPKIAATLIAAVIALGIAALGVALPVAAESAAELMEKGIYTEQTVGDLRAAIEIYTRIVDNAEANRVHVAEAQFRLGMCHLKRGSDAEARAALDKLIREFPEQEKLVTQAREQLAAVRPAFALAPVPWEDGEFLEYRISLPTGKVFGTIFQLAESAAVDGVDAWRLELRKVLVNTSNNYGFSRVLVERDTQRPIRSVVRHGIFGNADAAYGLDGVEITGGARDTQMDFDQPVYDNEQTMHLIRMLPLEPGYSTTLRLLPTWSPQVLETKLEVTGVETCQVPAGEFECFAVDLDIGQTFWYSTGPERYLLEVRAPGAIFELAKIGRIRPGAPIPFGLEDFDFSGELPASWWFHEQRIPGKKNSVMIRFLDPGVAGISAVEVHRCPQRGCPSLQQTSERELSGAQRRFDAYELREGSWTERTIDGRPAISFIGDYERSGVPWVQYRLYTLTDDKRFEFIFRTPKDRFEELLADFDSVAESLRAE